MQLQSLDEASVAAEPPVIWLYGLSGAGKSTLARFLRRRLGADGRPVVVLDGDELRAGLNSDLGFANADRAENVRRAAEMARLLVRSGVRVVCALITPLRAHRAIARSVLGDDLLEVYLSAPFESCARRDPKGLYAQVAVGQLTNFTGRDAAFEPPLPGDDVVVIDSDRLTVEGAAHALAVAIGERAARATPDASACLAGV